MPHPPIDDQDKRTLHVNVALSPREYAALSEIAGEAVSAWIRDAALEKAGITDTVRRSAPRRQRVVTAAIRAPIGNSDTGNKGYDLKRQREEGRQ